MGWLGGAVLVAGAVVVLRDGSTQPFPREFGEFLDDRVQYVADSRPLTAPTDLKLTAPDRTSLRATWTATGGVAYGGFEVRWAGRTRLVQATEAELTDLDADAEITVEVRAVDGLGVRSEPAVAKAVPRLAHDGKWVEQLVQPIDVFDGAEALGPHRWRVFGSGDDCLGLRPLNGKRLEVTCDVLDLQSNVPLRLGVPGEDGAVGRVVLTTDGPSTVRGDGELVVALLPEPFHDIGHLSEPYPPGSLVLRITPHGASFDTGSGVPTTSRVVPVGGTSPPPTPGVRHRWELRVLPDAVVALRDGEALAAASVAVPWTVVRPRLAFRNIQQTRLDAFGVGGAPESPVPASVVPLGAGAGETDSAELGATPARRLEGGDSVRVVAAVVSVKSDVRDVPITVEFGGRSAPAAFMPPSDDPVSIRSAWVYADFPLPEPTGNTSVRLRATQKVLVNGSHLVVDDGRAAARRVLPKVTDRELPDPEVPPPAVAVLHDTGATDRFPRGGRARIVVELLTTTEREIAGIKGVEVDLDGQRLAVLPTGRAAGGRHEFLLDLNGVTVGGHKVDVRVLPVDERLETRSASRSFEIGPP